MRNKTKQPEPETNRPGGLLASILEGPAPEDQPKPGHVKAALSKRMSGLYFVVAALDLCAFLLGATAFGRLLGHETSFEIGAQIFAGVLTLLLIKYMDSSYQIGLGLKGFRLGTIALLPLAMVTAAWMRPLSGEFAYDALTVTALGALTRATWEEACFRGLGVFLLARKDGRISWLALFGTSATYGALQLLRLVTDPGDWANVLLSAAFSVALGAFLMALYVSSKNLTLPILVHFLFILVREAPPYCSDRPLLLGAEGSLLVLVTTGVVLLLLAIGLFRRNELKTAADAAANTAEEPA